jgi:hypothetical protein
VSYDLKQTLSARIIAMIRNAELEMFSPRQSLFGICVNLVLSGFSSMMFLVGIQPVDGCFC